MTGLLIKDWKILKNQGRYFFTMLILAMLILIVGSEEYSAFAVSYITFLFAYFTLSTISYDEYDNGMAFLMTLPVSRRIYVSEKYFLAVLLTGGAWLFSVGMNFVFFRFGSSSEVFREMLCTEPAFLMVVFVFLGISLPLFLKYGPEKGRVISFGILGAAVLAAFFLGRMGIGVTELRVLELLSEERPLMIGGICTVFSVLTVMISYMVSLKLMEKKEF